MGTTTTPSNVEAEKYERMINLTPLRNFKLWFPHASTADFTYADIYAIKQLQYLWHLFIL